MKRSVATAIIGLLVMISAAPNLSFALRSGSLSRPPVYDDVTYLLDAYQRLAFGGVNSLGTLVHSFLTHPPHAPMSTLTAMLGYSLIGPYLWAAYAANVWMLGLFAAAVYLVARRNLDQIPSILVVALMLFVPAAHALITEFRPDQGAGVILACAVYLLVSTDYAKTTRLRLAALGFLVACAVMAKPSAVIATVPVLGLAAAIGILRPGYHSSSEAIYSIRAAILPVAVAIAILIPCIVVWGPHTYAYIYQALVTNKDMWATDGGHLYHWMFNSFGPGGHQALGRFLWLGLSCITLDALLSFPPKPNRSNYDALAFYFVTTILYCGIAVSSEKTVYQGSFFYFPFLLATTLGAGRILMRMGGRSPTAIAGVLLATAIIFMPATSFYQFYPEFQDSGPILASISNDVANEVLRKRASGCAADQFELAAMNPDPIPVEAVALDLAMRQRVKITPLSRLYKVRSAAEMDGAVDGADFVILSRDGGEHSNLPGSKFGVHTSLRLSTSADWRRIAASGNYELFAKARCR
jgi:4-amino-4-deoxy-L-arabinose transferase-like glycosyltransferase